MKSSADTSRRYTIQVELSETAHVKLIKLGSILGFDSVNRTLAYILNQLNSAKWVELCIRDYYTGEDDCFDGEHWKKTR